MIKILTALLLMGFSASGWAGNQCDISSIGEISGRKDLPANCAYQGSISITQSNTSLDCHGSAFMAGINDEVGLLIESKGKELRNVSVKNCQFVGYKKNGVFVGWRGVDSKKGVDHAEIYKKTPHDIILDNIFVDKSGAVGVYFDDYTQNIELKNSTIKNSVGVGIYLEHSSRNQKIINNTIAFNGLGSSDRKAKREGLAIDSSAFNAIEGNTFQGNGAGGIFLYKNCGEHIDTGRQVIRWQHSDKNTIKNNSFIDEKIGVWLASRQNKDLRFMGCGDKMLNDKGWYADYADSNSVQANYFCRTGKPVVDNGKNNVIDSNYASCKFDSKK
ncbi:MAG: right-handed parallel beta-helix repeat-containing protein [Acidovorax sp.]|uniref:NosD domain-containing protein n=1 Tax=Acidovorax sp. TaxID=1872122 RepID=UPI0039E6D061